VIAIRFPVDFRAGAGATEGRGRREAAASLCLTSGDFSTLAMVVWEDGKKRLAVLHIYIVRVQR
jgi:hypothetical protein